MSELNKASMGAKLGLSGVLVYHDKDGNVLKTVEMNGAIPLERLGLSVEQAQELIKQQENANGTHDSTSS